MSRKQEENASEDTTTGIVDKESHHTLVQDACKEYFMFELHKEREMVRLLIRKCMPSSNLNAGADRFNQ